MSNWSDREFADIVRLRAEEQLRIIAANRECYIAAWVAETGLLPSESQLVERRHADGTVTVTVRRRPVEEAR